MDHAILKDVVDLEQDCMALAVKNVKIVVFRAYSQ